MLSMRPGNVAVIWNTGARTLLCMYVCTYRDVDFFSVLRMSMLRDGSMKTVLCMKVPRVHMRHYTRVRVKTSFYWEAQSSSVFDSGATRDANRADIAGQYMGTLEYLTADFLRTAESFLQTCTQMSTYKRKFGRPNM